MTDAELDAIGAAVPAGRDYTMRRDRAIAEAVRDATIEECAKVVENIEIYIAYDDYGVRYLPSMLTDAASAIRALKGKP